MISWTTFVKWPSESGNSHNKIRLTSKKSKAQKASEFEECFLNWECSLVWFVFLTLRTSWSRFGSEQNVNEHFLQPTCSMRSWFIDKRLSVVASQSYFEVTIPVHVSNLTKVPNITFATLCKFYSIVCQFLSVRFSFSLEKNYGQCGDYFYTITIKIVAISPFSMFTADFITVFVHLSFGAVSPLAASLNFLYAFKKITYLKSKTVLV